MDRSYFQMMDHLQDIMQQKENDHKDNIPVELSEEQIREKLDRLQKKLSYLHSLHGSTFGIPGMIWSGKASVEEALQAEAYLQREEVHPFVFRLEQGLFSGKPKKRNYLEAVKNIQLLQDYYTELRNQIQEERQVGKELSAQIEPFLKTARLLRSLKVNTSDQLWENYQTPNGKDANLYLGDILIPTEEKKNLSQEANGILTVLESHGLVSADGENIMIPFGYAANEPFSLFVEYTSSRKVLEKNDGRRTPSDLIHDLMYQVIRGLPPYTFQFYYMDLYSAGGNLGEFQDFSNVVNGNAYWMRYEMFQNTYRLMEKLTGYSDLSEYLNNLESQVADTNHFRGATTIEEYNQQWIEKDGRVKVEGSIIPRKIVLVENIYGVTDYKLFSSIKMLAENAKNCGISLIVVSAREEGQKLSAEERELENLVSTDVLEWHAEDDTDWGWMKIRGTRLGRDDRGLYQFQFVPRASGKKRESYLKQFVSALTPEYTVETSFEKLIDIETEFGSHDSQNGIEIPAGVDERGHLVYLRLGASDCAHGLLTGATGCGKSSFLHTLINGVITYYKPDNIQMWLSDFKANEFSRYLKNTPPHITYVATDRTVEYCMDFLEKLWDEYMRRVEAFGTITSITEYRQIHGEGSMPRILVIIDEFHVLSDNIKDFPEYKDKLNAILREARSSGITLLLSDQECANGLNGLKEDGKNQLTRRMAMMSRKEEYDAVFDISNSDKILPVLKPYELLIKELTETRDYNGKVATQVFYKHAKTIYTDPVVRDRIAKLSIERYGKAEHVQTVERNKKLTLLEDRETEDGKSAMAGQKCVTWDEILLEAGKKPFRRNELRLYMGKPMGLEPVFFLSLFPRTGENIACVSSKTEQQLEVLRNIIFSVDKGEKDYQMYIITGEYGRLYMENTDFFDKMRDRNPKIQILDDEEMICRKIAEIYGLLGRRKRMKGDKEKIFLVWLDLRDQYRRFSDWEREGIPEELNQLRRMKKNKTSKKEISLDNLELSLSMMDKMFEEDEESAEEDMWDEEDEMLMYDAREDVVELLKGGTEQFIYNIAFFTTVLEIKDTPEINRNLGAFCHKIAFRMSEDDSMDFLGSSRAIKTPDGELIDEQTAVYSNGMINTRFVPYGI